MCGSHRSDGNVQTANLPLTVRRFLFGRFGFLLWLGIHDGGIFLVQIQLDVKEIEPVGLFFQFFLVGKGFLHLGYCRILGSIIGGDKKNRR